MSEIKVNKISPRSGTTVTLGDSGDTFTIPSGATINNQGTATNFGPTGSVSWQTTVKTSGFTAVAGEGYFVDTTSGAISVNLPAGTAGAVVGFKDYAGTFSASNKVTLVQNGSDKIGGSTVNASLETEGIAITLVFVDSTQGWLVTDSGLQSEAPTAQFIAATGGNTVATCGNFKIHTFTSPGTFCVSAVGNASGSTQVDYLVVAGGGAGAGGNNGGGVGGGGAGGVRVGTVVAVPGIPQRTCGHTVSVQAYPIVVGGGGANNPSIGGGTAGASGSVSSFSSFTAAGGGGGNDAGNNGTGGGSGGGGGEAGGCAGAGNVPPVSPSQGFPGGDGCSPCVGAGGGGIAAAGSNTPSSPGPTLPGEAGAGGAGQDFSPVFGSANGTPSGFFAGGGGGSKGGPSTTATVAVGGGGRGGANANACSATSGGTNTGGGGGGNGSNNPGGSNGGGSGIVIIRYQFQ